MVLNSRAAAIQSDRTLLGHTQSDPELKSSRQYTNLSAGEVRRELFEKGYSEEELPSERTIRDILNRMNYRLKRIQKGKPLKKTKDTDAIFDNVRAVHEEAKDDPETLEISVDTKAKVSLGEYVLRWGGPEPTAKVRSPRAGTTIRRRRRNWCRSGS
ncbi:MAG: hypothetical protein IT427_20085 [Pirellulales bacterium]|nr:hypothetical protein [Pirellulales bacterium]